MLIATFLVIYNSPVDGDVMEKRDLDGKIFIALTVLLLVLTRFWLSYSCFRRR